MEPIENKSASAIPPMPGAIAEAVVNVKKKVRSLGKDEENKFARYKYVSVDRFYEEIGQLMAEFGLFTVIDEISVSSEKRETQTDQGGIKASVWITSTFEIFLYHSSGAGYGPIHRTIMVQATGPQAFGSGMSYVEKYFLRSLFKVPTGDEDVDAHPREEVPARGKIVARPPAATSANVNGSAHKAPEKLSDHPRRAEGIVAFKRLDAALNSIKTTPQATEFLRDHGKAVFADLDLIAEVNPDTHASLKKRFATLGIDIDAERTRIDEPPPDYLGADDAERVLQ